MSDARQEAKDVICTIIAAAGGELHKKVALFKAFYYAHLFYWQEQNEALTNYAIVRMPQGPGIEDHFALLTELQQEGRVTIRREAYGPFKEYVFALNQEFTIAPNNSRYRAIEKAVKWVEGKQARELSLETRDYSRSWQLGKDGDELNIYIDLLDDEEYAAMQQRLRKSEALVNEVFGTVV